MNVKRNYNLELFNLLDEEPGQLSKADLSKVLNNFIIENNYYELIENTRFIVLRDERIRLLFPPTEEPMIQIKDWWDIVTQVYKKWKIPAR
jgi:hypothetical protein